MNFSEKLIQKQPEDCLPDKLPDNVLNFLCLYNEDKSALKVMKHYAFSLYCYSKGLGPEEIDTRMIIKDDVYRVYKVYVIFERIRRLGLVVYKPPSAKEFYTLNMSDVKYVKTELFNIIFDPDKIKPKQEN